MIEVNLGEYEQSVKAVLQRMDEQRVIGRIWSHDHTVWKPEPAEITDRLGWLRIAEESKSSIDRLTGLADELRAAGYRRALLLGMGGSSAIITAALRALMEFYAIPIPKEAQPTLILDAELKELGINAGFMDRVIQVYEGCVYMDLDRHSIETRGYGSYENLDPRILPPLYLAFKPELGKVSGSVLNPIRLGYDRKDPAVIQALDRIAEIADEGRQALLDGRREGLHRLMDENFDLRSRIMSISDSNRQLIDAARRCGASAKFAGSGGSIIGMYKDEDMFGRLTHELGRLQARIIKPIIV